MNLRAVLDGNVLGGNRITATVGLSLRIANPLGRHLMRKYKKVSDRNAVNKIRQKSDKKRFAFTVSSFNASPIALMPLQKVIVFGASARAWVQCIANAAHEVFAADRFADADTTRIAQTTAFDDSTIADPSNPECCEEWIRQIFGKWNLDPTEKLFSVYGGGLENRPELVQAISNNTTLLGNNETVLRRLLDTFSLHSWVRNRGFRVPRTWNQEQWQDLQVELSPGQGHTSSDGLATRILRKNHRSCGGLGIRRVQLLDIEQVGVESPCETTNSDEAYYQEYIEGTLWSACYLSNNTAVHNLPSDAHTRLLGISRQLSGTREFNARDFLYCGSLTEPDPSNELLDFAKSIGQKIASEYGLMGLFNVDFVETGDQFQFLELNPRYSASMELFERQNKENLFELHKAACLGNLNQSSALPKQSRPHFVENVEGKAIWYANRNLVVNERFTDFAMEQTDTHGRSLIADIPRPGTNIQTGAPVFTVFASGVSPEQVNVKLVETAKMFDSYLSD